MLKLVRSDQAKITESEFKWYLADAIINKRFSMEGYEKLTDWTSRRGMRLLLT